MQSSAPAHATATRPHIDRLAHASSAIALREKRFAPSKLVALIEVTSELGLDASAVLAGTDLDLDAIANPFTLTSSLQFLTAARNAIRQYAKSDLGVRVGCRLHASSYGMYGYALLCSEAMAHTFDTAVKYHQLANGALDIRWVEDDDAATWIFPNHNEVLVPDVDEPLYRFLIDLQFAVHVTVIKDVMGAWCVPARAMFTQAEPSHAALLSDVLECPLAFEQPQNLLSYPAAWLSRAPQLANPITAAQVSTQCARLLEQLRWQAGVTRRVYQELTRTPGKFPDIEQIAESLCMTSRTLRRKLEAEGASYSELLTGVRKALAIDYLSTTSLSIEDIALTLGFSDAVGFRHAFKRWTGKTPNEVRRDRAISASSSMMDQ
ncbi:AraC family transcriptional regulator [Paraburkholderia piptadeniae]|uniref:AraC family transcriptional regulator n=1 Tax=Paraburkholderia piptadeniae TaxID=1701573 RepID=A0A1N7SIZ8_9BURK|nr:AraC family transcriptional regulator [Paraburkholderia piptadeniae]SIT47280.1 AraC family transcriptional regulator [Paraburkholderia piptadeniae]